MIALAILASILASLGVALWIAVRQFQRMEREHIDVIIMNQALDRISGTDNQ